METGTKPLKKPLEIIDRSLPRKATIWLSLKIPAVPILTQTNYFKPSSKTVRYLRSANVSGVKPCVMPELVLPVTVPRL
jgi:hypothetical protein